MKRFNKMTDEELAVYLDQIISGETDLESLKSLDVDSLEVLSASRSAMVKNGNGTYRNKKTSAMGVSSNTSKSVLGVMPEDLFIAANINNCCMMDTSFSDNLPFANMSEDLFEDEDGNETDDLSDDFDPEDTPF